MRGPKETRIHILVILYSRTVNVSETMTREAFMCFGVMRTAAKIIAPPMASDKGATGSQVGLLRIFSCSIPLALGFKLRRNIAPQMHGEEIREAMGVVSKVTVCVQIFG